MKNILLFFCFILCLYQVNSQQIDFSNYTTLKSRGDLPKVFIAAPFDYYQQAILKIPVDKSKVEIQEIKDYELASAYEFNNFIKSGKVIFNDTVGNYLNLVMQKVLEHRESKRNIIVCLIRSSNVASYSSPQGVIFLTMGLFARLHNEAELAFILAHEYVHFLKKHKPTSSIDNSHYQTGYNRYFNRNVEDAFLSRNTYTKTQELEADELGFDLIASSTYKTSAVLAAIKAPDNPNTPFDSIVFSPSFFEIGTLKIPSNFFVLDSPSLLKLNSSPINVVKKKKILDDEDEEEENTPIETEYVVKLTETNADERLNKVKDIMVDFANDEFRSNALVSETSFLLARKICRFELPRLSILNGDFEKAIYSSMVLLKGEPNSLYLKKCIAKALYGFAKYSNADDFNKIHINSKGQTGSFKQLVLLFGKLNAQGVNVVALNYCWKLKADHPEDKELDLICSSLMQSFITVHEKKATPVFYRSYTDTVRARIIRKTLNDNEVEDDVETPVVKKDSKSKKKKVDVEEKPLVNAKVKRPPYIKKSLIYWFESDTTFKGVYERLLLAQVDENTSEIYKSATSKPPVDLPLNTTLIPCIEKNKVLLVNPYYFYSNGDSRYNPIISEQKGQDLNQALILSSKKIFNNSEIISGINLEQIDADKLNDIALINDCLYENFFKRAIGCVSTDLMAIRALTEKYGSSNFLMVGLETEKTRSEVSDYVIDKIPLNCIYGPATPIAYMRLKSRGYQSNVNAILYNSERDDFVVNYSKQVKGKATPGYINSNIYHLLNRIKTY